MNKEMLELLEFSNKVIKVGTQNTGEKLRKEVAKLILSFADSKAERGSFGWYRAVSMAYSAVNSIFNTVKSLSIIRRIIK